MQTNENNQPSEAKKGTDKRTDFFEQREMNNDITDGDNAGNESFTPIYLNNDSVLQTPEEKKKDESINAQKNDKLESINVDAEQTTFDKMNDEERNGIGE